MLWKNLKWVLCLKDHHNKYKYITEGNLDDAIDEYLNYLDRYCGIQAQKENVEYASYDRKDVFILRNKEEIPYQFKFGCGDILIWAKNAAGNKDWIEPTISTLKACGFDGDEIGGMEYDEWFIDCLEGIIHRACYDLDEGFIKLFKFIVKYPNSITAANFIYGHFQAVMEPKNELGEPSFSYLEGEKFNLVEWVDESEMEQFLEFIKK